MTFGRHGEARTVDVVFEGAQQAIEADGRASSPPAPSSLSPVDFVAVVARIRAAGASEWKDSSSEGESLYFLDPNGHRLEAMRYVRGTT